MRNHQQLGCGGPALFYSACHVIINTAVGTSLYWRLTRCHRVLPLQVSYGLIGWVKYSKSFVCICKHTATRIRIWRGCPAEVGAAVGYLAVRFSWLSALHCNPCPAPLDGYYPPSRLVSNYIWLNTYSNFNLRETFLEVKTMPLVYQEPSPPTTCVHLSPCLDRRHFAFLSLNSKTCPSCSLTGGERGRMSSTEGRGLEAMEGRGVGGLVGRG